MRILFDPQAFYLSSFGVFRYYKTLYHGLLEAGIELHCPVKKTIFRAELPEKPNVLEILPKKWDLRVERFQRNFMRKKYYQAVAKSDYDLLYITSTKYESHFLKHLTSRPFVMTVHDTMHMVQSRYTFYDQGSDYNQLGHLAHRAERVACVSNHTKNDLCQKYRLDMSRTQTVYPGNFLSGDCEKIQNLPESYILFVGVRSGRKNFFEWLKAVSGYLSKHPDLYLVVTGELKESEVFFAKKFGIENNLISYENVTDAQLNTLYRNALCLAFPSLYEGFGLPVLEAMSNGCPVITSDRSSLPEVAGSAALLVDPLDNEMMLNALKKIHNNAGFREEIIKKGLEQSRKFSNEKFTAGMIDVFDRAVQSYKR